MHPPYVDFVNFPQVKMILDCIFHNMHHIHNIEVIKTFATDKSYQPPKMGWKDGLRNLARAIISLLWWNGKKFEKLNNYDGKL